MLEKRYFPFAQRVPCSGQDVDDILDLGYRHWEWTELDLMYIRKNNCRYGCVRGGAGGDEYIGPTLFTCGS